jgi:hypothetical protein
MPPKKAPKFKKPRLGRAGRAGRSAPDKKNSQKLKQTQRVTVNITSGGGGGGSTAPALPFYKPEPFVYTKRQNLEDINLFNMIQNAAAKSNMVSGRGNILGRADPDVVNPANDATTTTAVFNAPINNADSLAEEVLREIKQMGIKPKPIAKPPPIFNAPNTNNLSLAERIIPAQSGYASEYGGGETDTGSVRKRKPRSDKGLSRGSTKEKYKQVGFEEGVPAGRNIQNEFVMGVEQMQNRRIKPGQMRLVPTEETMENAPAQSTSSAELNFA